MTRKYMPSDLVKPAELISAILETALVEFLGQKEGVGIDNLYKYLKLNETLRMLQYATTQLEMLRKYLEDCECE